MAQRMLLRGWVLHQVRIEGQFAVLDSLMHAAIRPAERKENEGSLGRQALVNNYGFADLVGDRWEWLC